jgi:hypothetical protein
MDTLDQPLSVVDYVDQFFKQCGQPLITLQEAGPASCNLAAPALPAQEEDSPQGKAHYYIFYSINISR